MYRHTLQTSHGKVSFLFREGEKYIILLHGLGGLNDSIKENMKVLETKTGKGFGSDKNPLLVSLYFWALNP